MRRLRLRLFAAFVLLAGLCVAMFFACRPPSVLTVSPPAEWPMFEDVTADSGIDFTYHNGEEFSPALLTILESLGGGGAALDFDGDGRLDLFFTGGGYFAGGGRQILGHPCRLFRNKGDFKFEAVAAGVLPEPAAGWFYSHGVAAADYDRDGWPDLLVTGWQRVALFHNEPDGQGGRKFTDVTASAGLDGGIDWATSAAWADLDGDGFPDLYICQYTDWSFDNHPTCSYDGKTPDICPPTMFRGLPHKLYRNIGGKRFEDVSATAGLHTGGEKSSYGLGVLAADLDGDRKPEVYVANDSAPNFLYLNQSSPGQIRLREQAAAAGVAVDAGGRPTGSMGVDAGDPLGTGKPALWVTNFENETHAVYRNESRPGVLRFQYASEAVGVTALGKKYVGWGTGFADFDRNGWEDLLVAHGHAFRHPVGSPRQQRAVLLLNDAGTFSDRSDRGGGHFASPHAGRGVVLADLDDDGRVDVVVCHSNEPVAVLRNVSPADRHWIGVELRSTDNADLVGARVELLAGGRTQTQILKGGGSYASSGDRRLVFGLGSTDCVDELTVVWPDGKREGWIGPAVDRYHRISPGNAPKK